jgi:hypothetical protein
MLHHKIKLGGLPVAEDARRVAAAVRVIGDGGRLALDANNAYRSVREARTAIEAFERPRRRRPRAHPGPARIRHRTGRRGRSEVRDRPLTCANTTTVASR